MEPCEQSKNLSIEILSFLEVKRERRIIKTNNQKKIY